MKKIKSLKYQRYISKTLVFLFIIDNPELSYFFTFGIGFSLLMAGVSCSGFYLLTFYLSCTPKISIAIARALPGPRHRQMSSGQ